MIPTSLAVEPDIAWEISRDAYARLLQTEPGRLDDHLASQSSNARLWYAAHGRPGVWMAPATAAALSGDAIAARLDGAAEAVVIAVSAGPEVDEASAAAWADRPDRAWFLDRLGAAVAEHLVGVAGAALCQVVEPGGRSVIAPLSPGCGGWELAEQAVLHGILAEVHPELPVALHDSGGLSPKNALLAVCGITDAAVAWEADPAIRNCRACAMQDCAFRRR